MNSFTLNQPNFEQSFTCSSTNSVFLFIKVIISQLSTNYGIEELQKYLVGFYLEIQEVYDKDDKVIHSRSRPFELSKEIDPLNNSIHFNRFISNEELDMNSRRVFYNKLIVKLSSRYSVNYDFSFEIVYDGHDIVQIKS